jgi:hypothetical protein
MTENDREADQVLDSSNNQICRHQPYVGDGPSLAALSDRCRIAGEIDWTEVCAFASWAEQHPDDALAAIATAHPNRLRSD